MIESVAAPIVETTPAPALGWREGQFTRSGRVHQVFSGSLHYFRVHPDLWRDRLLRLVDMGLNTVDTYVPWNFHQPEADERPDFTGWRDVEQFITTAGGLGLDVVVRPGPYICAEWSNGGLPTWLTARGVALRSSDPAYLGPVAAWFDALVPRLAALQHTHGGPVVAVQVENEFGSYGDDAAYMQWMHGALVDRGITELLFTADGPTELMLDGGAVDEALTAITMGSRADDARRLHTARRPGEPFLVAEFWNGWFDHWGEHHHVRSADDAATTLRGIVQDGGNVSLYMAHGGTNFGLWAGANELDGVVQPTVTSYDSDAPVAEDGTLTDKFHAFRTVFGATAPVVSPAPTMLPKTNVHLKAAEDLLPALRRRAGAARTSVHPLDFDTMGLDGGLVLHEASPVIPTGEHSLVVTDVRDTVTVFVDGVALGTARGPRATFEIRGEGRSVVLTLVVESLGRVNYGPTLGQRKGIVGPVLIDRRSVQGWRSSPLALQRWDASDLRPTPDRSGTPSDPGLATARFELDEPGDTHIALPGSGKGFVWINGFLLGRYWSIGPQQTLYCPAPLLRSGPNVLTVLEQEHLGSTCELLPAPVLGPPEQYVEVF